LYELLNPVIKHPVDLEILQALQDQLHGLIRQTFGNNPQANLECFVLPELEILTELEPPMILFPLNPELPNPREGLAVHICLDGNELDVTMQWGGGETKNYRISQTRLPSELATMPSLTYAMAEDLMEHPARDLLT
jgi:hypothetical protein